MKNEITYKNKIKFQKVLKFSKFVIVTILYSYNRKKKEIKNCLLIFTYPDLFHKYFCHKFTLFSFYNIAQLYTPIVKDRR